MEEFAVEVPRAGSTQQTIIRWAAAVLVAVGGILHLMIWNDDYRAGVDVAGAWVLEIGFPVQGAVSLLLAVLILVLSDRPWVWAVALLHQVLSITFLVVSRYGSLFGLEVKGWGSQALQVLFAEFLASVLLTFLLVEGYRKAVEDEREVL